MATANSSTQKQVQLNEDFFDDIFGDEAPENKAFFVDEEDGAFKIGSAKAPKTQDDVPDEEDDSALQVAGSSDSASEEKTEKSEPSALDKRVASLESSVNKLIDLFEKQSNFKQTQQDEEVDDEDDEFDYNPKSFRRLIQEEIEGALKPYQQRNAEQAQKELLIQDYQKAAAKYGEDTFKRYGELITDFVTEKLSSDPNVKIEGIFESAINRARKYESIFRPAKSDSTRQAKAKEEPTKKVGDAKQLQEKVKALETQEGVSKTGQRKTVKVNNVREAFDEALEELFGSAGYDE